MKIKNQKDFYAGLMFTVAGGAFAWAAASYNLGTGARMGPGYFPLMLAIVLLLLGMVISFTALTFETEGGAPVGPWAWKPLVCVLGANLVFGACLGIFKLGLVVGIYALVTLASLAADRFRWREVLTLASVLALGSYLVFIFALKLQIPLWPAFLLGD